MMEEMKEGEINDKGFWKFGKDVEKIRRRHCWAILGQMRSSVYSEANLNFYRAY